ncbi:uncharacterized protein LOC115216715, partial [Argonauta hians]
TTTTTTTTPYQDLPFRSCVDIFRLNANFDSQVSDSVIDGIPVKTVRSCLCDADVNMTIEYFLRDDQSSSFISLDTTGPVRVEMKGFVRRRGGRVESFTYLYHFLTFDPAPSLEEEVFQVPHGVVCNSSIHHHPPPNILPQFSTHGEVINTLNHRMSVFNILFDWQEKLMRLEYYPEFHSNTSDRSIRIVTDYKLGIQFTLDTLYGPCVLKPSYSGLSQLEQPSWGHVMHVADTYSLMSLSQPRSGFTYKGKLKVRGMMTDVWAKQKTLPGDVTVNREYYFLEAHHTTIPVGMYQKVFKLHYNNNNNNNNKHDNNTNTTTTTTDTTDAAAADDDDDSDDDDDDSDDGDGVVVAMEVLNESWLHLYGYSQGHVHLDNFNVESCFQMSDRLYVSFRLEDNFDLYINGYQTLIFPALRNSISRAANISGVRVSNIQIARLSSDMMLVQFTLLDTPSIPESLRATYHPITARQALTNLKSHSVIEFKVFYPLMEEKVFRFDTDQIETLGRQYTTASTTDTRRGSMVGLGIGMLFIGACMGLLSGYFIYRRVLSADIPYELTK